MMRETKFIFNWLEGFFPRPRVLDLSSEFANTFSLYYLIIFRSERLGRD